MMPPLDTGGPHLDMRAIDHVSEYLAHERMASLGRNALTGRWECKRSSGSVIASYHAWAKARSLRVIPEWQFLNLLADQEGVDKSRDRLKDASGRVLKNERGTPLRTNYYTIFELPQAVPHSRSRPPEADVRRRRVA